MAFSGNSIVFGALILQKRTAFRRVHRINRDLHVKSCGQTEPAIVSTAWERHVVRALHGVVGASSARRLSEPGSFPKRAKLVSQAQGHSGKSFPVKGLAIF
jgi:hypothetical protein